MFRVGQKFLAFQGRTMENACYGDLNSDIPVYQQTPLNRSCVFIDIPVTGLCHDRDGRKQMITNPRNPN